MDFKKNGDLAAAQNSDLLVSDIVGIYLSVLFDTRASGILNFYSVHFALLGNTWIFGPFFPIILSGARINRPSPSQGTCPTTEHHGLKAEASNITSHASTSECQCFKRLMDVSVCRALCSSALCLLADLAPEFVLWDKSATSSMKYSGRSGQPLGMPWLTFPTRVLTLTWTTLWTRWFSGQNVSNMHALQFTWSKHRSCWWRLREIMTAPSTVEVSSQIMNSLKAKKYMIQFEMTFSIWVLLGLS